MTAREMLWKVIPSIPEYEASEYGDIRRCVAGYNRPVGYRLKGFVNCDGYLAYSFRTEERDGARTAASLVAEAFHGPRPSPQHEVAHSSGSRVSCHAPDLRWATRKENSDDRVVHATITQGERNGRAKISEADVHAIRREYRRSKELRVPGALFALERRYGLHRATIVDIATGRSWRHVGSWS